MPLILNSIDVASIICEEMQPGRSVGCFKLGFRVFLEKNNEMVVLGLEFGNAILSCND